MSFTFTCDLCGSEDIDQIVNEDNTITTVCTDCNHNERE
jgi:ribosome-binding protein aMBF1 (putative translation factor)